MSLFISYKLLA